MSHPDNIKARFTSPARRETRLLELATELARNWHEQYAYRMRGGGTYVSHGHMEVDFDACQHPDCVFVREAALREAAEPPASDAKEVAPGLYAANRSTSVFGGEALGRVPPADDYKALYHELLYQVGVKHPGESRHDTALRYLRQAETGTRGSSGVASARQESETP